MTPIEPPVRRARPLWADVRFLLGVVLIVVSVAGVWLVVAAARQTTPILVAARPLVPGHELGPRDLRVVEVALGAAASSYLSAGTAASGLVATRAVAEGELVPVDAVGDASAGSVTRVVLRSDVDVPASVAAGSTVEVWAAPLAETGGHAPPRILVADAVVASVTEPEGVMGGGAASVEVVIPRADAADVLAAVAEGDALAVLPVVGGAS